jgi:hypothetical protein
MPVATTPSAPTGPSTASKMEDRKRPAVSSTDDLAPPSKRVAVNGSKTKDESVEMKEEGWIEVRSMINPSRPLIDFLETRRDARRSALDSTSKTLPFLCGLFVQPHRRTAQGAAVCEGARVPVKCRSSEHLSRHFPRSTASMEVPALEMILSRRQT